MAAKPKTSAKTIDQYLAALRDDQRRALETAPDHPGCGPEG